MATGYFLDFWGQPFIKTHMPPYMPAIDIKHRTTGIPGTGNEPVSFAYSYDVARFIAEKLLFLPDSEWEPVSLIVGDVLTWNEFLALAEEATGASSRKWRENHGTNKFQVPNSKLATTAWPISPLAT